MRSFTILLITLLSLVLVACGGAGAAVEPPAAGVPASAPAAGNPRVSLETDLLELGDLPNGVVAEREVAVANTGNAPLVVESVTTSCGCTSAVLEPMTLAPGERGNLRISFDSGAHGPDLRGELLRRVILTTNDPAQPEAIVELKANITDPVR